MPRNSTSGAFLNCTTISVPRFHSALPDRRYTGTPSHRQLSIISLMAAYVGVPEFGATPCDVR